MIKRLRTALRHPVSKNVIALYGIQIATFVVPMITLPYVSRILQPSAFGMVVFAQGFALVLVVFIDWGFGFTGIRSTAESESSGEDLTTIVRRVRGAQLVLAGLSLLVAVGAYFLIPKMHEHPVYLVLAWIAAAFTGLSPGWFFLGTERMRIMTAIQLGFRALGAVLTFVFVRGPDDAWVVMALFAGTSVGSLIAADVMMYRDGVRMALPRIRESAKEIKGATMIFIGTVAVSLYTSFNVVLLGIFEPSPQVGHFGAAERLVRVSMTVLGPIGAAVIPRMTALQAAGERERARKLLTMAVLAAALPALALTAVLVGGAPLIIRIVYGHRFVAGSVPILRILSLIIPINVVGVVFAMWLMTLHRDRLVATVVASAAAMNICLGCILTPLFGPTGMAWAVVCAEGTTALGGLLITTVGGRVAARRQARAPVAAPVAVAGAGSGVAAGAGVGGVSELPPRSYTEPRPIEPVHRAPNEPVHVLHPEYLPTPERLPRPGREPPVRLPDPAASVRPEEPWSRFVPIDGPSPVTRSVPPPSMRPMPEAEPASSWRAPLTWIRRQRRA